MAGKKINLIDQLKKYFGFDAFTDAFQRRPDAECGSKKVCV